MLLSPLQVRHAWLARQGLNLLPTKSDAMRAMVAVQTQYAQSLGQALAARSEAPEAEFETEGLQPDGCLVKSWTLRGTVHTHTREDFALVRSAVGESRYRRFRDSMQRHLGMRDAEYEAMEGEILAALDAGPLTRKELHRQVPGLSRVPWTGWGADVKGLAYRGQVSFIGTGTEQRFARLRDVPQVPEALSRLARRYFLGYGPATVQDFRFWTGAPAKDIAKAVEAIRHELKAVHMEGHKAARYLVGDLEETEPRPVSLLAKFDPLLMGFFHRFPLLEPAQFPRVFRIAGQVEAVLLIRGEPRGTWRQSRLRDRLAVRMDPWGRIRRAESKAIEAEAARLAEAYGLSDIELTIG
ncbi:MAG TPA: winged helix DNA-binding domain-containing protein [Fimbriimonas sp.]